MLLKDLTGSLFWTDALSIVLYVASSIAIGMLEKKSELLKPIGTGLKLIVLRMRRVDGMGMPWDPWNECVIVISASSAWKFRIVDSIEPCISRGTMKNPLTPSQSKGEPLMVRQAHHERNGLIGFHYFCKVQ